MMRDEIVNAVSNKGQNVKLGLPIGDLLLNSKGQVQFRSKTISEILKAQSNASMRLTENNLKELSHTGSKAQNSEASMRSRQSIAERSINYMQKRQSAASAASRGSRKPHSAVNTKRDIFENSNEKPYQDDIGMAPYFQRRMMSR